MLTVCIISDKSHSSEVMAGVGPDVFRSNVSSRDSVLILVDDSVPLDLIEDCIEAIKATGANVTGPYWIEEWEDDG